MLFQTAGAEWRKARSAKADLTQSIVTDLGPQFIVGMLKCEIQLVCAGSSVPEWSAPLML